MHQRFVEIELFRYAMFDLMTKYDVLISPVAATAAKKHGETFGAIRDYSYSFIQSLSGCPSTVIPCGKTSEGLPIGIQVTGRLWRDNECLAVAKKIQEGVGVPSLVLNGVRV